MECLQQLFLTCLSEQHLPCPVAVHSGLECRQGHPITHMAAAFPRPGHRAGWAASLEALRGRQRSQHAGTRARAVPAPQRHRAVTLNFTHTPPLAPAFADTPKLFCYRFENLEILYSLFICHGPSYGAERTWTPGHPRSAFVPLSSSEPQYRFASSKRYFKFPLLNPLPQS